VNLTQIQFGRELDESEVLKINLILKKSAKKFIASGEEELLYPEKHIDIHWTKLDDDWSCSRISARSSFQRGPSWVSRMEVCSIWMSTAEGQVILVMRMKR
jgi:hypothetical protein